MQKPSSYMKIKNWAVLIWQELETFYKREEYET